MQRFDEWLAKVPVSVSSQNVKKLMQEAYNGGLKAAAAVAHKEYEANNGPQVVAKPGDAVAQNICNRIRAFMDKESAL
jgi:hypothetical protein